MKNSTLYRINGKDKKLNVTNRKLYNINLIIHIISPVLSTGTN